MAQRPFDKSHQVPQCESDAYAWAVKRPDGTLALHFAVENPSGVSAKALAAILEKTLSGLTPEEIASISPEIVEQIFRQNISMGKGMGLMGMVNAVRALAARARSSVKRRGKAAAPGVTVSWSKPVGRQSALLIVSFAACDARLIASCAVLAVLLVVSAASLAAPTRFWAASVARSTARVCHGLRVVDHAVARVAHQRLLAPRFRKRQPHRRADRHRDGADRQRVVLHPVLQLRLRLPAVLADLPLRAAAASRVRPRTSSIVSRARSVAFESVSRGAIGRGGARRARERHAPGRRRPTRRSSPGQS